MVDSVMTAGRAKGLVVFPGVELMVANGERGIHINLIFDVDKNAQHVDQFLNRVKVFQKDGKPTPLSELTVGQVADELEAYDPTAIMVLAHCHSSKGVSGDIKGEARRQIFLQPRRSILGAEANESDFLDPTKTANGTRVIDLFNGTNRDYNNRRLGVFQASDAHSLEQIGTGVSYFKVDHPLTIEDLRQCLVDRDTRIRQPHEFERGQYPHIRSLEISSGYLKGQRFEFHEGLHSILGGKGSGKSLAIEALRFALHQPPISETILEDHNDKLEKCVQVHTVVTVELSDDSGHQYRVARTYQPSSGSPTIVTDLGDGSRKEVSPAEVFPVLFLSQNEIVKIVEDRSGAGLRRFIDRFFDFHNFQHRIDRTLADLRLVDKRVAEALRAHFENESQKRKASALREEIAQIDRQLSNPAFEKYRSAESAGEALRARVDFIDEMRTDLEALTKSYSARPVPTLPPTEPGSPIDPALQRAQDAAVGSVTVVVDGLTEIVTAIGAQHSAAELEWSTWASEFKPIKEAYDTLVKESGASRAALDERRRRLVADLATVDRASARIAIVAQGLRQAIEDRNTALGRVDAAQQEYLDERSRRCKYFGEQSKGALEVTIAEGRDTSQFRSRLQAIKRGTYLKDEDIAQVAALIRPEDLISAVLKFEFKSRNDKASLQELSSRSGIRLEVLDRLATRMLEDLSYEELLALAYDSAPQDVPEISYRVAGVMKPLKELSVGQKASALLIIGLSDGRFPIVIDQPEDSLDLRTIWADVCCTLRDSKERRQFIFTTHNSSVAVASDSDKFTILEAGAGTAQVIHSGSMNSADVREEVIGHLEGGAPTYERKRSKYRFND